MKVAHPNLYTFLGHLQRATTDSEAEVARTNRGLSIRRSKRKLYIANDARIKTCISRYDNGAYTRIQFLNAVSHSVGAHSNALCEVDNQSDSDDETDGDAAATEPQEQHRQPHSLTTMQSCVRSASSSHVNRVWHWCLAAIA